MSPAGLGWPRETPCRGQLLAIRAMADPDSRRIDLGLIGDVAAMAVIGDLHLCLPYHTLTSVVAAPKTTVPPVQMAPHLLRIADSPLAFISAFIHPS